MLTAIEPVKTVGPASLHLDAAELGMMLHPCVSRARMICVLKAYLDESGIHQGSRICAIAGFVGGQEEWEKIERQWNRALSTEGVAAFHMAEFENRQGPYADWSNTRRQDFLGGLVGILKARDIFSVGSGIVTENFLALSVEDRQWMTHGNPDIPYFLCFQHCIVEAAHHADGLDPSEKVGFTFDRNETFVAEGTRLYDRMKDDVQWDNRFRLADTVAFASKRNSVPLQVADFAAYETYKQLENKLYNPSIPVRWPIRQFQVWPFRGKYFTMDALQDLIANRPR